MVGHVKVLHVEERIAEVTEKDMKGEEGSEDKFCMVSTLAREYVKLLQS